MLHLNDEIPVQLSVEHLLQSFFKIERIDDVECSFCKQKLGLAENPKRAFLKTISIAKVLSHQSCVCNVRYCLTNYMCIFSASKVFMHSNTAHDVVQQWNALQEPTSCPILALVQLDAILFSWKPHEQSQQRWILAEFARRKEPPCEASAVSLPLCDAQNTHSIALIFYISCRQNPKDVRINSSNSQDSSITGVGGSVNSEEKDLHVKPGVSDQGDQKDQRCLNSDSVSHVQSNVIARDNAKACSLSSLVLAQSSSASTLKHQYKLKAVIEHYGDVESGHFVTYRRAPTGASDKFSEQWLYTSDTIVRKVSKQDLSCVEAYMLFYERVV